MKKLITLWVIWLATIWASFAMPNVKENFKPSLTTGQVECLNNAKQNLEKNLLSGQNYFEAQVKNLYEKKQNLLSWVNFSWNIFSWENLKNYLLKEDYHKFFSSNSWNFLSWKNEFKSIKKDFQKLKINILRQKLDFYKTYKSDIAVCKIDMQKSKKLSKDLKKDN